MNKNDLAYIEHILECIRKIQRFSKGFDLKRFSDDELVQDAIIRNIEVIGEASKKYLTIQKRSIPKFPGKRLLG